MNLKNISTEDLVKELENREGVEKVSVGLYAPYELREKYVPFKSKDGTRGHITADTVLIVNLSEKGK